MNTRRNACQRAGEAAVGGNQVPPQALVVTDQVPVNEDGLTDADVMNSLIQMAHAIITHLKPSWLKP